VADGDAPLPVVAVSEICPPESSQDRNGMIAQATDPSIGGTRDEEGVLRW
jgi:hypothetical protein